MSSRECARHFGQRDLGRRVEKGRLCQETNDNQDDRYQSQCICHGEKSGERGEEVEHVHPIGALIGDLARLIIEKMLGNNFEHLCVRHYVESRGTKERLASLSRSVAFLCWKGFDDGGRSTGRILVQPRAELRIGLV